MKKEKIKQIIELASQSNINYLYLFGSQARKNINLRSDFDFAVKFDTKKIKDTFDAKLELMANLSKILQKEDVDVVNIEEADPLLHFNILKDGVVIYEKDKHERTMDRVRAMNIYRDRSYYYNRHFKIAINQMAAGQI